MKRIVWLASFPKSGNTWLRLLLASYFDPDHRDHIDLDEFRFGRLASARLIVDEWSVIDSSDLTDVEAGVMRPQAYRALAASASDLVFLKTHQAWARNTLGEPIFPADATATVMYAVRNPLDVAVSLASHMNLSLTDAVALMSDDTWMIGNFSPPNRSHFPERVMSWSRHVGSWLDESDLPIVLVRYEDLRADTAGVVRRIIAALGHAPDPDRIRRAVEVTAFERLQQQERERGFGERHSKTDLFFRGGRVGDGNRVLSKDDRRRLLDAHGPTMQRLGYAHADEPS